MSDDLSAPLGLGPAKRAWWKRLPFGLVGGGVLALVGVVVGGWIAFVRDPAGGEPSAVVKIDRSKTGIARGDVGVADAPKTANGDGSGIGEAPAQGIHEQKATGGLETPRRVPEAEEGQPLSTTPIQRVSEKTRWGTLPKIAADGTRPFDIYARPTPRRPSATPQVVLIIGGLGISQTSTQEAIRVMPADVTLAFAPYGASLERWTQRARSEGHELLLQIPMEPFDYPDNDPGPQTLLAGATVEANTDRLLNLLGRITNYVGVVNYMGAKFTADEQAFGGVAKELASRGLMLVDDGSSSRSTAEAVAKGQRLPFARGDVVIDAVATDDQIRAKLSQLEQVARTKGLAVGTASALPITLRIVPAWAKSLESKGLVLVPVSAVARGG